MARRARRAGRNKFDRGLQQARCVETAGGTGQAITPDPEQNVPSAHRLPWEFHPASSEERLRICGRLLATARRDAVAMAAYEMGDDNSVGRVPCLRLRQAAPESSGQFARAHLVVRHGRQPPCSTAIRLDPYHYSGTYRKLPAFLPVLIVRGQERSELWAGGYPLGLNDFAFQKPCS